MKRPLAFLLLAVAVGCQQGDKQTYANVSGTVTYNGKPVEKGQITFALEGRPPSTMDISDGQYTGQAMIGSNKVVISAKRKSATAPKLTKDAEKTMKGYAAKKKGEFGEPPIDYDPTMVEYIPAEWNVESKQMRVIEAGAANNFAFDIKGK